MPIKLFITGTDTGIGKTYISVGLLKAFNNSAYTTLGLKPIASGCSYKNGQLRNQDALDLQQAASIYLNYNKINPLAFQPAIAPHIAAARINSSLSVDLIIHKMLPAFAVPADVYVIEGVGGWCVPLNHYQTTVDLVKQLDSLVILVVGIRLGCLNHALLTYQAIQNSAVRLAGWVANCIEADNQETHDMIETLKSQLKAPCLGIVAYQQRPEEVLSINQLLIS